MSGNRAARASGIAYCWIEALGRLSRPLALVPGIRPQNVYRAATRGREADAEWRRVVGK
jgi:hypothetical protein